MKYIIGIVLFFIVAYNSMIFYIDKNINTRVADTSYNNCKKVWCSRGIYNEHNEQNSLLAFQRAFSAGHIGIEVDFYYDVDLDKFIVSHNKPTKDKNGKLHYSLKGGKLFTLEELFKQTAKGHYYWLDYKNLDRLSREDTQKAIKHLDCITKIDDVKERIYIEGSTPWHINDYTDAGYKTLFAFQALPYSSMITSLSSSMHKIAYYFYNITAIAMPYGKLGDAKYNEITQENLKGIPTFLFHVPNDDALLHKLVKKEDVRVLLVGQDKSISHPEITSTQHLLK